MLLESRPWESYPLTNELSNKPYTSKYLYTGQRIQGLVERYVLRLRIWLRLPSPRTTLRSITSSSQRTGIPEVMGIPQQKVKTASGVMGVPYGNMDFKVATAPKTESQSKVEDKFNERIKP